VTKNFVAFEGGYIVRDVTLQEVLLHEAEQKHEKLTNAVNPDHYKQGSREVIDEMREMSTIFEFQQYCRLTALKYLKRSAHKGNFPQDMAKAAWYCQMAAHVEEPSKYKDPRTL
jgi:Protein of unknwon function (DUF3310)